MILFCTFDSRLIKFINTPLPPLDQKNKYKNSYHSKLWVLYLFLWYIKPHAVSCLFLLHPLEFDIMEPFCVVWIFPSLNEEIITFTVTYLKWTHWKKPRKNIHNTVLLKFAFLKAAKQREKQFNVFIKSHFRLPTEKPFFCF